MTSSHVAIDTGLDPTAEDAIQKMKGKEVGALEAITPQERIDQIQWYHEFDFPNGLKARSRLPPVEVAFHRKLWDWTRSELDKIDFTGKTVLDIGCWDGFWSFYAKQRGASRVLATDDETQNWAGSAGLDLAKELLGLSIETRTDVSIYEVAQLGERFDIVLCMGVYYHLVDPFFAFSQIRRCTHERSVVVFEGDFAMDGFVQPPQAAYLDLTDERRCFMPTLTCFLQLLAANYFRVTTGSTIQGRVLVACEPFVGENSLHRYRPPFGLHNYDPRFSDHSRACLLRHNARIALRAGDLAAARTNFIQALRLEPSHLKAYKGLLNTFLPFGLFVADLRRLRHSRAGVLRHKARMALRAGDRVGARTNFIQALRLEPSHLKAYKGLLKTYLP